MANAAQITHGLKTIGFGQSMLLGVAVIAVSAYLISKPDLRRRIINGLL
jgi:hypothetical protein